MKKIMMLFSIIVMILTVNSFAALTVAQARALGDDVGVEIGPIILSTTNDLGNSWYYINAQDESGGIQIVGPGSTIPNLISANNLVPGSCVTLSGTNENYGNSYQITWVDVAENHGVSNLPAATLIDIDTLATPAPDVSLAALEGKLVSIKDVDVHESGTFVGATTYTIWKNGKNGNVRIQDQNDPLVGTAIPIGSDIIITGIFGIFFDNYQIYPLSFNKSGLPLVNITNQNTTVAYDINKYTIGGTINVNVVGDMSWSNQLTGLQGSFSAVPAWSITDIALNFGANVIVVFGTNIYGDISSDFVNIYRETWDEVKPFIDITSASAIVSHPQTIAEISGTNVNIAGQLVWVNDRNPETTNLFAQGFSTTIDNLAEGNNLIQVFGTNIYGYFTNDFVNIYRETWDEVKPFIDITNTPAIVPYPQTTVKISGTNVNIAGQLVWVNDRNPETINLFTQGFSTTIDNLAEGNNLIQVFGTNIYGYFTNDFVNIYRETWDEVHPFIDITNTPAVLIYFETTAEISGTNLNITGQLSWVNDENPEVTNLFALGFSTIVNEISEGNNLIEVYATNMYGYYTNDTIVISRQTSKEAVPVDVVALDGNYPDKIKISWGASIGADKYRVYRNISDLTGGFTQISGDISTTNFTDSTITPGQLYYYWVKAGKDALWSDLSKSDSGYALFTAAPKDAWKYKDGKKFDVLKGKDITPMLATNLIAGWQIGLASISTDGTLTNYNGPHSLENKKNKNKLWFLKMKKEIIIKYKYNEKKLKDKLLYKLWDQMPNSKVLYLIPANLASNQSSASIFDEKYLLGIELIEKDSKKTNGWRELTPVIIQDD